MSRCTRAVVLLALVVAGLGASATNAFATHFRYGTITWTTPNPAQPNVIQVRFDSAWRRSYFSPAPLQGQVIPASMMALTLDILNAAGTTSVAASIPISPTVTAVNAAEDWMSTSWTQTVVLPGGVGSDFVLQIQQCCRVSTIIDANHDVNFRVLSKVTVRSPINRPPTSASLPIISVVRFLPVNFVVPAFDPDGDALFYELTPLVESGMVVQAPAGSPQLTIHPTTGRVSWTPTSVGLYSVQFKVTDTKGATGVIDILFQVLASGTAGALPTMTLDTVAPPPSPTFNVVRGTPLTFAVGASTNTSPASAVTLNSSSLPIGANMSPSLPTSNIGNVSSNFYWTPAPNQLGSYIIQYSAVSATGLQSLLNININVTNNSPTVTCAPLGTIAATGPSGASVTITSDLADADDDLLSYLLTIDGLPRPSVNNLNPPNTQSLTRTFSLGTHTYVAQVTDSFSPTVTCSGTFTVADLEAPTLSLPSDISLVATGPGGAAATFSVTATDVVDTTPTVSCSMPSGSTFPIGTTPVECTATDDAMNSISGSFNVTVTQAATSLSPVSIYGNALVGSLIEFTTTLTRTSAPAGEVPAQPIRWVLTGPGPSDTLVQGSITNVAGYAYLPFTPTQRGVYTLTAYFDGGGELAPTQSASTTITVYQRTQLYIDAFLGTAGELITERAQLIAQPQGTPLPGNRTVTFSYTGPSAIAPVDVVAEGDFVTHTTFPLPGTYTLTTTFADPADFMTDAAGTIPPAPTVSSAAIPINPVYTQLDDLVVLNNFSLVGTNIEVQTNLRSTSSFGPQLPGRTVLFTLTSPSGSTTTTATTADFGHVSVGFPLLERGVHTVMASYAGDATTTPSASNAVTFTVYQQTQLVVPAVSGVAGGSTGLAASLMLVPQNTPLAGQAIQFSSPGFAGTVNGTTDGSGSATATGVFPSSGSYSVQAQFDGVADFFVPSNGGFNQPQTASGVATISAAASAVAITTPANALVQGSFAVSAILTRTAAPAGPVDGALVMFRLTAPSSNVMELWATTDASGTASVTFTPTERGVHTVSASFSGNAALEASSSAASSISVYQRAQLTLAPASGGTSALPVVATLMAVPQNSPLSNQQVQFSFDGVAPPQSALTNGAGAATVSVALSSIGTFASHAMVSNAADFLTDAAGALPPVPSTADSTITVTDATAPVITPVVTGTLGANQWYTSDVQVAWTVTDPESTITSATGCATTITSTDGALFEITCSASSAGGSASRTVSFKRDASAPMVTPPANKTATADSWDGVDVTYAAAAAADPTSGVSSTLCAPPSGSTFPIGVTTVTCTAVNGAGLSASGSFTVTVVDPGEPGKMFGNGRVAGPNNHRVEFDFTVFENRRGFEWGDVRIKVKDERRRRGDDERFDATTVDDVFFSNAPDYGPGRNSKTGVDTVTFRGLGRWDGRPNYRYIVTASDRGEPGRGRDTFTIQIVSPSGVVVFEGGGTLADGNVQSTRLQKPWSWWNGHNGHHWNDRNRGRW
jgi:hypothetical protein